MIVRAILFCILFVIWIGGGLIHFDPAASFYWLRKLGFWFILTGFVMWLAVGLPQWKRWLATRPWRNRRSLTALAIIIAITFFFHARGGHGFKIVQDELLLASTSMQMHDHQHAEVALYGYPIQGDFVVMKGMLDKRPFFFPFLVSLLHDLTGYRPENAFLLNALLTPFLLGLVYVVGERLGGPRGGILAVLMLASIPLVQSNVTGGGFEILNLVMILLTAIAGWRFLDERSNERASFLALSAALLCQVRYESGIFLIAVAIVFIYGMWLERKVILTWSMALLPILMLPVSWQWRVFQDTPDAWQLGGAKAGLVPFSIKYVANNLGHAVNFFFSTSGKLGNSLIIAIAGIVGLVFFLFRITRLIGEIRTGKASKAEWGTAIFIGFLLLHGALMLCYFWGQFDDILVSRLSLPLQLFFIFSFVGAVSGAINNRKLWVSICGVTILYTLVFTASAVEKRLYYKDNYAARTANWARQFIIHDPDRQFLVIDNDVQLVWTLYHLPALNSGQLFAHFDDFLFHKRMGTFSHVYVLQRLRIDPSTGEKIVGDSCDLGPGVSLDTVKEERFSPTFYVRLSEIGSIDVARTRAWLANRSKRAKTDGFSEPESLIRQDDLFNIEWVKHLP